jgi:hypothetical protein
MTEQTTFFSTDDEHTRSHWGRHGFLPALRSSRRVSSLYHNPRHILEGYTVKAEYVAHSACCASSAGCSGSRSSLRCSPGLEASTPPRRSATGSPQRSASPLLCHSWEPSPAWRCPAGAKRPSCRQRTLDLAPDILWSEPEDFYAGGTYQGPQGIWTRRSKCSNALCTER